MARKSEVKKWLTKKNKEKIMEWAIEGISFRSMAIRMGITWSTFKNWKNNYSEFNELMEKCDLARKGITENSLMKKANGFTKKVQKQVYEEVAEYNENGKLKSKKKIPVIIEVEQYYPPDTTALIFTAINKMGDEYSNKKYYETKIGYEKKEKEEVAKEFIENLKRDWEKEFDIIENKKMEN